MKGKAYILHSHDSNTNYKCIHDIFFPTQTILSPLESEWASFFSLLGCFGGKFFLENAPLVRIEQNLKFDKNVSCGVVG